MTMLGVYEGNSLGSVTKFESWLGRDVDGILAFTGRNDWKDYTESADWAAKLWAGQDRPIFWSVPLITNTGNLESAAHGDYNAYYRKVAEDLAAANKDGGDIHVRTGWEFNGEWFPWKAKGREEDFVGAWKQFVDTFRSVSDHFVFEWTVNAGDMGMNPEKAYPGDAYVDVIGMDFYYNTAWDPKDPDAAWDHTVNRAYGLQWHQDFAAAHGKKTAYSEWGVKSPDAGPYVEKFAAWLAKYKVDYHSYWDSNADFPGKLSDGNKGETGEAFKDQFEGGTKAAKDGGAGDDTLYGTGKGERLDGKAGADAMIGQGGGDAYYVDSSGDRVVEKAGEGTDEIRSTLDRTVLPDNVENLTLLSRDGQTAIGNDLANRIVGGAGDDVLDGRGGDDRLMGGSGHDTIVVRAGSGRDTIVDFKAGDGAGDVLRIDSSSLDSFTKVKAALESFGSDTLLTLPSGEVVVFKGHSPDQFAADDFAFGGAPPAPTPAWNPAAPPVAPSPIEISKSGGGGADHLAGTDGNDYINGGGGSDTMTGGKGHDTYVVDRSSDTVVEKSGQGIDTVDSWAKSYQLPANVEHLKNLGSYAQEGLGNSQANRLAGGSGPDELDGGSGNDWLTGGSGADTFIVRKGTGHEVVTDMKAGSASGDVVRLENYGWTSFSQVKAALTQKGGDALLTLPGGDTVLFKGVSAAAFTAGDFHFEGGASSGGEGGTGKSTVVVRASADSWDGSPEFALSVDGKTVGGDTAVTTKHGSGWQEFSFTVSGNSDPDTVVLRYLNDDWDGGAKDRNLYVDRITVNGHSYEAETASYHHGDVTELLGSDQKLSHDGTLTFHLGHAA